MRAAKSTHARSQQLPNDHDRRPSDPFLAALLPPPDETPEQREARLQQEEEARKRSENIDRMLRHDDKRNRRKKTVKVLLLGQSESGKSTTLKQFQLLHTPAAFHKERIAWRFVIYLNLVRSIRRILEAISPEDINGLDEEDFGDSTETASIIIASPDRPSSSHASNQPNYEAYRRRLAPLMDLEQRLINVLSDPEDNSDKEATHLPGFSPHSFSAFAAPAGISPSTSASSAYSGWTSASASSHGGARVPAHQPGRPPPITIPPTPGPSHSHSHPHPTAGPSGATGAGAGPTSPRSPTSPTVSLGSGSNHEPSIRTGSNWKKHFALGKIQSQKTAHSGELEGWWEDPGDPVHVLNRCAPVMKELWADPKIQQRLAEKKIRLEESSGFYLDEIDRITAKMYFPTDDDVLKARLKTTGVVEHKFTLAKNTEFRGVEWVIYDVGGARNQRQAWAPYFDDVNAIIFLAPISAFDQQLAEDPKVNRLEDSFLLWKSVIESRLLAHVNIVLFLNKCDLLKKKLESGVRLKHYMPSFNRPNDYDTVSQYFRNRFGAMHQQLSPNKSRELFIHLTAVTDTPKTHIIISNVRDIILTANLKSSSLM
ncbi:G-alpha-domain-containing protein [Dichomitus squalens LYAD-421 SS1]|uniref:G-alpha-domain-containing protein n=1 Tax=Dichomitus squalens (strain LYAD-421) TaxID=732165 RepID=UPI000441273A|nr:G-alpha-domain-containing protein [Dichomitus squalens LYAD-421 SS1]EJF67466.1 G-alpha-domain-containing protein [Dichomitus squalens LYAD-421 SS1]